MSTTRGILLGVSHLLASRIISIRQTVDSLLELLANFEKRKLLWGHGYLLSRLWITPLVCSVLLYNEASESANLDATTADERIPHLSIYEINDLFGLDNVDLCPLSEFLY